MDNIGSNAVSDHGSIRSSDLHHGLQCPQDTDSAEEIQNAALTVLLHLHFHNTLYTANRHHMVLRRVSAAKFFTDPRDLDCRQTLRWARLGLDDSENCSLHSEIITNSPKKCWSIVAWVDLGQYWESSASSNFPWIDLLHCHGSRDLEWRWIAWFCFYRA